MTERTIGLSVQALDRLRRTRTTITLLNVTVVMVAYLLLQAVFTERPVSILLLTAVTLALLIFFRVLASRGRPTLAASLLVSINLVACTAAVFASGESAISPFFVPLAILYAIATLRARGVLWTTLGGAVCLLIMGLSVASATPDSLHVIGNAAVLLTLSGVIGYVQARAHETTVERGALAQQKEREASEGRARLVDELAEVRKMEALGRLAGGIAHDFNNSLQVLQMEAELGAGHAGDGLEVKASFQRIEKAAEQAQLLTSSLLAFARQQNLESKQVELSSALESLLPLLRTLVTKRIELSLTLTEHPVVQCAPVLLEQIVMNLVVNARDAMPGGGQIKIELTTDRSPDRQGRFALLRVQDEGGGIAPKHRPHIFEPFYSTKSESGGTGLGLATCHGITAQLGGDIRLLQTGPSGTSFEVRLPLSDSRQVSESGQPSETQTEEALFDTILVVDDNPAVLDTTVRAVSSAAARTLRASSLKEARTVLEQHGPQLDYVLTDFDLGNSETGADLLREARRAAPEAALTLMSGQLDDSTLVSDLLPDHASFLPKPFSRARALQAIDDAQQIRQAKKK